MKILTLALLALASGCTHELTADAIVLVESTNDLELTDGSLENFRPHVGVSVTTTTDPKVFHSWSTEEKWRVVTTNGGEHIDGAVLCQKDQAPGSRATFAVTQRAEKTIWVGPCVALESFRLFILAHEVGHMVGADDCDSGVMKAWDPSTLELSESTKEELRGLYQ